MVFNNKKKGQSAVEFLIILVFVLTMIALIMYIFGFYLIGINEEELDNEAKDFVDNVNGELGILNVVEEGYYREMRINIDRYDINITNKLLILKDKENGNKTYYLDLIGNFELDVINKKDENLGSNFTYIVFKKDNVIDNSFNLALNSS